MKTQVQKKRQFAEESIEAKPQARFIEPTTARDEAKKLWEHMLKNTGQDIVGGSITSVAEQLLGAQTEAQLIEGQEISLTKPDKEKVEKKPQITGEFMEYSRTVQNVERVGETRTEREVKQAVEEIRAEIKRLMTTSKLVERTVKDATAEKAPVKPGKYHLTFFEFVLNIIKDATRKLEDSVHFGAVFTSKKQQSHYWNMTKKKGTSFMLSGERTSATQTG